MDRQSRSSKYQYELLEIPYDFVSDSRWTEDRGLYPKDVLNTAYTELNDIVTAWLLTFMRTSCKLTELQLRVINLMATGATQEETGAAIGVNQSSINKSLRGAPTCRKGTRLGAAPVNYGGSYKKIRNALRKSEEFRKHIVSLLELT